MKTKNFKDHLGKRLTKNEVVEVEELANIEFEAIKLLQQDVSRGIAKDMAQEKIDK
jgi:hypothetical protein